MQRTFPSRRPGVVPSRAVILAVTVSVLPVTVLAAQETVGVDTSAAPGDSAVLGPPGAAIPSGGVPPGPAAVVIGSDTIGFLYGSEGITGPQARADRFRSRIRALRLQGMTPDSVRLIADADPPLVAVGGEPVLAVTPADVQGLGLGGAAALDAYGDLARRALAVPLLRAPPRALLVSMGLVVLCTMLLWLLWRALAALEPRMARGLNAVVARRVRSIRFQGVEFVSAEQLQRGVDWGAWALRMLLSLALLAGYLPLVFWFFPATQGVALWLLNLFLEPLRRAGLGALRYSPNLVNIAVILFLTKKGLDLLSLVFTAVERGKIRVRGFYADWARPTYQLLRLVIVAFAVVVIWPYLPRSNSPAFQGVAAFLGLLLTFGSAGAVSNAVGGVVMVYMRPFQIGDRVRIADTMGDVVERGILVTRVRTPKNVVITIPNSQVLGSHIVNYSRVARNTGLVLHTTVTIGYDVPWPRVHAALIAAAGRVEGILDTPPPFVLQTALGDYAVHYELNAHTRSPERMTALYSDLHTEIQNEFAHAGIEITSPVYHAVRDGNPPTIPPLQRDPGASA